jgi:hypothetical protein
MFSTFSGACGSLRPAFFAPSSNLRSDLLFYLPGPLHEPREELMYLPCFLLTDPPVVEGPLDRVQRLAVENRELDLLLLDFLRAQLAGGCRDREISAGLTEEVEELNVLRRADQVDDPVRRHDVLAAGVAVKGIRGDLHLLGDGIDPVFFFDDEVDVEETLKSVIPIVIWIEAHCPLL